MIRFKNKKWNMISFVANQQSEIKSLMMMELKQISLFANDEYKDILQENEFVGVNIEDMQIRSVYESGTTRHYVTFVYSLKIPDKKEEI